MGPLGIGLTLAAGSGRAWRPGFDFAGALPAGVTLTRASPARRWSAAGVLVTEAANVARFDHDPATGAPRGLLVEAAATNCIVQGAAFDAAAWTTDAGGTGAPPGVTADAAPAPDGTMTADRIAFARGDGFARIATAAAAGTGPHVLSLWLRAAAAGPAIALRIDGAVGTTLAIGTEWRRYMFAATTTGATTNVQLLLWSEVSGAPAEITVDAWGAQFEAGAAPTSFVPTAGAAAGRSADVLQLDWAGRGVSDGPIVLRCQFDDGTTQEVATTVSSGITVVPAGLARPWLRRIELF